ncbi:DUF4397 domain-containing protein [Pedobacter endophyticus]|uniref:DUF4397 domain-containing protein n=1 Tax=Pedobacter endophyticus TaxID=2789740 RepID=A0A7S9Q0G3_9SPHI|nr:DUF4397 domain-containing protein [Pedobacter endophyticus]QPH40642.1 DUF4397 domain-containing protein [Pedobacter endophyticus]
MKFKNYLSTSTKIFFSLLALTLTISACKKDFNDDPIEAAGIGFVHASPGTGPLDFIVDNQKGGTFTYTKDLGYYSAYPGTRLLGVAKKDSLKYLTNLNATLKPGIFYSVFVVDTLKSTKLLVVEDDLKAPETDKAKVRFINLSPGSAAYDLGVTGTAAPLFTAKAFKEFTPFINIAPNDNYSFELKQSGTVKVTLPAIKIEKGKIYTIWAKGLTSATDSTALGLSVLSNN